MSERGIIMAADSVRAILAGTKTQTRRVVTHGTSTVLGYSGRKMWDSLGLDFTGPCRVYGNPTGPGGLGCGQYLHVPFGDDGAVARVRCKWEPGNRLWVRETWRWHTDDPDFVIYRADGDDPTVAWKSPLFLPRKHSRLTLEVVEVRVQRVRDLTVADAEAEGIDSAPHAMKPSGLDMIDAYRAAWDALNGRRFPWSANPWVWVLQFRRLS